jgi:hypothetical protein
MAYHPVRHGDGPVGFVMHIPDEGVEVANGTVHWTAGGRRTEQPLSDLTQVRLYTIPAGKYRNAGRAELTFRGGRMLTVLGTNGVGLHDPAHASAYRAFLHDLHAQVPRDAHGHIAFTMARPKPPALFWPAVALVLVITSVVLVQKAGAVGLLGPLALVGFLALRFGPLFLSGSGGHGPSGDRYNPDHIPAHLMP